ncbi:acyl-CoA-like ligand-binding transcription factor [Sphaerisporangium rhizosphaerae]|uniref:TetR family transcriptional regulator n=1 Tax=Sphaerisporangium rhizosphaerae TaxID=2269375 RepID=A0ABW2P4Q1_9ACTN
MRTRQTAGTGLRARKKLTTRQALARAALQLAVERGPGNVRREDIAAAVDVSLRTFNNYFSGKEDAIVWLAVERAAGIGARLRDRPAEEPLGEALIAAFAEQHTQAAPSREWIAQIRVIVSEPELRGAYLKALAEIESVLAEAIAERIGADVRHDLHPRVVAAAACAAERAAIGYWLESDAAVPLAEVVREAIGQVAR